MIDNKKEYGINILKQILTALHEKRFGDVISMADECSFDESEMVEFVQGTVELNEFETIDEYMEDNLVHVDEESDNPFMIESYLTADDGNDLPLCLKLEFEFNENGTVRTLLNIDAD